jgi:Sigma-70, region 4
VTGSEYNRQRIEEAYARLEPGDRRVLPLRELQGSSYGEIAAIMGLTEGRVPELLWRARLGLRDELHGSALTPMSPISPRCRHALPLIARRDDRELHDDAERNVLERHLRSCGKCRLYAQAMREASAAYRDALLIRAGSPAEG